MKIGTRLLWLFLLVAVLPLALFSYFNLQQLEVVMRNKALERLGGLADKKVMQVKNYLMEREREVRIRARGAEVIGAIDRIPGLYATGRHNAGYAHADASLHEYFGRYIEETGRFYDAFVITLQGEVVYSQKHESDFASNLITGPYRDTQLAQAFREVSMMLEPVISGYEYYLPSQAPALFIAAPIMVEGKLKGVFAVQLGNELFYKVTTDATGLGLSGEVAFAQFDGNDMLYTTPLKHRSDAAMKLRLSGQTIKQTPMFDALSGTSGEGVKPDYRDVPVVAAWRYLPELAWGMVVKIDADEEFAPIYRQRTLLLEVLLGLLLFAGWAAYYFGRQISAPIAELAQSAAQVAKGEPGRPVDESAPGELGLFARAFNRMTANLQEFHHSLEQRIEERTRELNVTNEQLQEEIIEREHIEKSLQESRAQLMGALDDLRYQKFALDQHAIVATTDVQGTITYVNEKFCEVSGYSAQELIGQNHRLMNSGVHPTEFFRDMYCNIAAGKVWNGEICNRAKDGSLYWLLTTIVPYLDSDGKPAQYIALRSDITERKRAEEKIQNLAFYDFLTGLPNRRLLREHLQIALSLSARSHQRGALLFLDMDKFKTVNDTLGHNYGDLMLVEVGRRIRACVRETDTVSRMGGDEFVVLIGEISASMDDALIKVASITEKMRAALSEPYRLKEHEVHGSSSIGVSMYCGNAESIDTLMKHADMAMYQAKDAGRNAVRFFDPKMQQTIELHARLEADLHRALPNRQLQLFYQIQVDSDLRPIGAEALIRWLHPQRGMVSPAQFIPVAEESSLILDIGHWVIETACGQLAQWQQHEQMRHLVLAVNVSAPQFRQRDFVQRLQEVITRHSIAPERLKLELTESVVLEDVADVAVKMHALKALGVRLSLDDFGTGYSSLAYLKKLPLDQIKIDQSFVRDISTDFNDAVMVKTIIDMAQNFRLNVIAEGVETEAQLTFLKQNGCMAYQGYLFGRPVPVAEFEVLARRLFG